MPPSSPSPYQNPKPTQNPKPSQNHNQNHAFHVTTPLTFQPSSVFYFEHFPDDWKFTDLQRCFAKYGIYGRVILARKRTKSNRRFGFLHMDGLVSNDSVLSQLNIIEIGYFRIRAFKARFPNPIHVRSKDRVLPAANQKPEAPIINRPAIRDRRSYAQVLQEKPITYNTPAAAFDSFKNSLIVKLRKLPDLLQLKSVIKELYLPVSSVSFLGGQYSLLNFDNENDKNQFCKNVPADFFETITPWNQNFRSLERYVWITVSGIPAVAWDDNFFQLVANRVGKFIAVHPNANLKERMDSVSFLISAAFAKIDCQIPVIINGLEYSLAVHESDIPVAMTDCLAMQSESEAAFSDDEDSSGNSAMLLDSEIPSLADREEENSVSATPSNQLEDPLPASDSRFITKRRNSFKRLDNRGSLQSVSLASDDISREVDSITGLNKLNSSRFSAVNSESIFEKAWSVGLQLGLFSAEHKDSIIDLLSQNFSKDGNQNS